MIFQIAWRNIWRNPLRSSLVMVAIALGLWAAVFMFAFSFGMMESRTRDILETQISHIQFHDPEFEREDPGSYFVSNGRELLQDIEGNPSTQYATSRFLANGILNSTKGRKGTFGVQIVGITPDKEAEVTSLPNRIIHGSYFNQSGKRVPEIILGKELAEKIGVLTEDEEGNVIFDPKRKVTLSNIVLPDGGSAAVRVKVVGIYKAQNTALESVQVFINKEDLQRKLGIEDKVHEIAVLLKDGKELSKPQKDAYQKDFEDSIQAIVGIWPAYEELKLLAGRDFSSDPQFKPEALVNQSFAEKYGMLNKDSSGLYFLQTQGMYQVKGFALTSYSEARSFEINIIGVFEEESPSDQALIRIPASNFYHEGGILPAFDQAIEGEWETKVSSSVKEISAGLYLQSLNVQSWNELAPEIDIIDNQFSSSMRIMVLVILFALGFGIVNTMLMAILERTRELGMLMSIGMNKTKVFLMIMLETVFLTFIGAPIGMGIGWLTIYFTNKTGIDLTGVDMGTSDFGMASIVNPALPSNYYFEIAIMVIFAGILSSIYPALRAIRLRPAEAVRAI